MDVDKRQKDVEWQLPANAFDSVSVESAQLAVLMDIRDELQSINTLLDAIKADTARPKRKAK